MGDTASSQRPPRVSILTLLEMKRAALPIAMLTAYDAPSGRLADEAGADVVLVGDSLGTVVLGYDSTLPVTLDDMLHHGRAVVRGVQRALVVVDMPFMTFQVTAADALRNAGSILAETGAHAVKVEGGATIAPTVRRLTEAGIPVMGHVGLTPQSVHQLGGFRVQAKDAQAARRLRDDCLALQDAGAFAVVLECIPAELAEVVSSQLTIPTIGIGAGVGCDGQVQVFHDILGLGGSKSPRHAKRYAEIGSAMTQALGDYVAQVRGREFPGDEQSTRLDPAVHAEVLRSLEEG